MDNFFKAHKALLLFLIGPVGFLLFTALHFFVTLGWFDDILYEEFSFFIHLFLFVTVSSILVLNYKGKKKLATVLFGITSILYLVLIILEFANRSVHFILMCYLVIMGCAGIYLWRKYQKLSKAEKQGYLTTIINVLTIALMIAIVVCGLSQMIDFASQCSSCGGSGYVRVGIPCPDC